MSPESMEEAVVNRRQVQEAYIENLKNALCKISEEIKQLTAVLKQNGAQIETDRSVWHGVDLQLRNKHIEDNTNLECAFLHDGQLEEGAPERWRERYAIKQKAERRKLNKHHCGKLNAAMKTQVNVEGRINELMLQQRNRQSVMDDVSPFGPLSVDK